MTTKKVLAIALALPSIILTITISIFYLIEAKIISMELGLVAIVLTILNSLYLMIKYVYKKQSEH